MTHIPDNHFGADFSRRLELKYEISKTGLRNAIERGTIYRDVWSIGTPPSPPPFIKKKRKTGLKLTLLHAITQFIPENVI